MNLVEWSERKLRLVRLLAQILNIILIGVIPTVFICINYGLFTAEPRYKIPAMALIFLLIVYIGVFRFVKKMIDSIKPITTKRIYFKALLNLLCNLILPVLLFIVMLCAKDAFDLFWLTFKEIVGCFIGSIVVENIFIDIPTWILNYDDENLHDDFKEMRRSLRDKKNK